MLIAIQSDNKRFADGHHHSYSDRWIKVAKVAGHSIRIVDVRDRNIIQQLQDCDGFMWRFSVNPNDWALVNRILPVAEDLLGLHVFPNWKTAWHYNDKVTQTYLLEAAGIPIPKTWIFWSEEEALHFSEEAQYPLILKLAVGAGSVNVILLNTYDEARMWVQDLFGPGVYSLEHPEISGFRDMRRRLKNAYQVLVSGRSVDPGRYWRLQKNYVLLQEFLSGNDFDTRVTVIGNRAFAFRRFNRIDDFRASGSGNISWDPDEIDLNFVRLAFEAATILGTQSIAVDGLYRGNEHVICEISYTYASWAVRECPGHWELQGNPRTGDLYWVDGKVWPQDVILDDFLTQLAEYKKI